MAVRFKQLSKTSTEWASLNPTLLEGEIGFESDTNKLKVGNGVDAWNNLEYVTGNGSDVDASNLVDLTSAQTITGVKTFKNYIKIANPSDNSNNWGLYIKGYDPNDAAYWGICITDKTQNVGRNSTLIGQYNSTAKYFGSVAIGTNALANSKGTIVIGADPGNNSNSHIYNGAIANAEEAIQIGHGTNNNIKTFQVWDYQLLDGNTGYIPNERLNLGTKKYLHRIKLNLSDQVSGTAPTKMAVIHLDYYSEQETAYTNPNFATIALASSIGCSGYYTDTDTSLTEKNFVYEIALPQSNEFVLNSSFSITIQSTGSSITDEVIGYVLS